MLKRQMLGDSLPWLMWEGIPWVGALGSWASWWERSFPECRPKLLVPGKLMVYVTKLCPMNKICIDPASLFKTQKKKKIFFSTLLSWVPENCSLDRCSSASFDCSLPPPNQPSSFSICFSGCMGNQAGKWNSNFKISVEFVTLARLFSPGIGFLAGLQLIFV